MHATCPHGAFPNRFLSCAGFKPWEESPGLTSVPFFRQPPGVDGEGSLNDCGSESGASATVDALTVRRDQRGICQ